MTETAKPLTSHLLKVSRISKQAPDGVVFTGTEVDVDGNIVDVSGVYTVLVPKSLAALPIAQGSWLAVQGEEGQIELPYIGLRKTLKASAIEVLMPSGQHVVDYLQSRLFTGIGQVKAERLWETYQDSLFDILDRGDIQALTKVLGLTVAQGLVEAWQEQGFISSQLRWLADMKIPVRLGTRMLRHYKTDLAGRLKADPYDMLAFSGNWIEVDTLARDYFKIKPYDERRLLAAVEHALFSDWRLGNTCAAIDTLEAAVRRLIASDGDSTADLSTQLKRALTLATERGAVVTYPNTDLCSYIGAAVLEQLVAAQVVNRLNQPQLVDPSIGSKVDEFEQHNGFKLTAEQRQAVITSAQNGLSLITGGAGVGKTTVLNCLIQVLKADKWEIKQLALAGKAAKRMVEATGQPASTIANYLATNKGKEPSEVNPEKTAIIIDECSMVDLVSFGRFLELTDESVKLILVGDENQIMPVGSGLVLHELVKLDVIKHSKLTVVKRYKSTISKVANSILTGNLPKLGDDAGEPISWLDGSAQDCQKKAVGLFLRSPADSQILCETKNAVLGTKELNKLAQRALTAHNAPLKVKSDLFNVLAETGFNLQDRVICNKNHWDLGLQNGSIGDLVEIAAPETLKDPYYDSETGETVLPVIARIKWDDGVTRDLTEALLPDISLAYAITIHKSQGSQWENVIILLSGSRMLDRNLLYTAITRTKSKVTLLGDFDKTSERVTEAPLVKKRRVLLAKRIRALLEKQSEVLTMN